MVTLSHDLKTSATKIEGSAELEVLYSAMHIILVPLMSNVSRRFRVNFRNQPWACHPVVPSYYTDTPEEIDIC